MTAHPSRYARPSRITEIFACPFCQTQSSCPLRRASRSRLSPSCTASRVWPWTRYVRVLSRHVDVGDFWVWVKAAVTARLGAVLHAASMVKEIAFPKMSPSDARLAIFRDH